ncbi:hypothetical protein [Bartonella sp. 1-1C]|nr:hypothetical protein [Bartonella sp. 1-1C]ATO56983.1 hypothetical protein B11Cv2_001990 [Bartonella sp. 1-1C]CBI81246.1 hypothetical protein B11C_150074 [Bartonella sp. 1-1C]
MKTSSHGKTTTSKSSQNKMPSNGSKKSVQSDMANNRQYASKTGRKNVKS